MTLNPAPANDAPLDDAAELPAGAALEAIDAAAVDIGMDAELPAEAAPLDIIIIEEAEAAMDEEPAIIIEEATMEDATAEEDEAGPAAAGPAEEAQAQTAAAEVWTASPV